MNHVKTSENAMRGICHMFGISAEAYVEAWYETGCAFAEKNHPLTGKHLIRSLLYWSRWNKRWVDVVYRFIEWNNPDKTLSDLCRLASDKKALMPNHLFFIDKYPVR